MICYFLLFFCLSINLLINLIFHSKKRVDLYENKVYIVLLIINLICILFETLCNVCAYYDKNVIGEVFVRLFLAGLFFFGCSLTIYTIVIGNEKSEENKSRKTARFMYLMNGVLCVPLAFLKLEFYKVGSSNFATGDAVKYMVALSSLYIFIALYFVFKNRNKIKRKSIPIITYIFLLTLAVIINKVDPSIPAINCIETFVVLLMYFTIENPDVKMLQQVELEKERADKANAAKSDFLSSMSHEIRTPLNAIVGFSECVLQSNSLEEAKENAQDIVGASQTLLEIVNGILDISKIESGKIELVETDYNPNKMIDEMVKLAKGRLGDKPLDFNVNIAPDIPNALYGDKANIKKVIINLLTNAIKYTDEGYVNFDVQCAKFNNHVRLIFIVKDSGRGIKKEDISKLFTRFQRLDEEKNQTIEGTGLGLAITKQLVEMMKGTIVVDSKYGDGSTFTVALDQKISDVDLSDTTQQMNVVVDLTGKKVLVVDDNKLNLKLANKLLSKYNITVTVCDSGHDCYELIENGNKYDLILLDDMMPKMSGTQTLEKLRQIPNFSIPVIALTANAINGMKEKYLAAGFDGYLAKPIDQNELYSVLVKFMHATASFDNKSNSMVIKPEEKEEVNEEVKVEPKEEIVPRISKVGDIPKFNPDKTEIIVIPGDKDKLKEELKFQEDNEEPVEEEKKEDTPNEEVKEQKNTKKASSRKTDKVKILIVDDNNLNIKVESKLITALGYDVEAANSGIEAIKMVQNTKYDLIFMDIMMPMMDGVKTLHELNKLDGFDTKVIALTADAVLGAKDRYLSEGFDEYITKPMSKEEFDTVIKKHLK